MKKVLIFDMDGTLFYTARANYHAYKEAIEFSGCNCSISEDEFIKACYGKNYKDFLVSVYHVNDSLVEKIHSVKCCNYDKFIEKYAKCNEFLFDVIESIKERYSIVLFTTAAKNNTYKLLEYFEKKSIFDLVVTADDVNEMKPQKEGFIKILEHFGAEPSDVVFFDDSKDCIETAGTLGIKSYMVI